MCHRATAAPYTCGRAHGCVGTNMHRRARTLPIVGSALSLSARPALPASPPASVPPPPPPQTRRGNPAPRASSSASETPVKQVVARFQRAADALADEERQADRPPALRLVTMWRARDQSSPVARSASRLAGLQRRLFSCVRSRLLRGGLPAGGAACRLVAGWCSARATGWLPSRGAACLLPVRAPAAARRPPARTRLLHGPYVRL